MSELAPEIEDLKEHLKTTWNTGDDGIVAKGLESSAAEDLRFDDASFDLVISLIGAMFTP